MFQVRNIATFLGNSISVVEAHEFVLFGARQRQRKPLKHNRRGRACVLNIPFKHERVVFLYSELKNLFLN